MEGNLDGNLMCVSVFCMDIDRGAILLTVKCSAIKSMRLFAEWKGNSLPLNGGNQREFRGMGGSAFFFLFFLFLFSFQLLDEFFCGASSDSGVPEMKG